MKAEELGSLAQCDEAAGFLCSHDDHYSIAMEGLMLCGTRIQVSKLSLCLGQP